MRRAAKVDANQAAIVRALRCYPSITVETGHDDLLVGYNLQTFWFEVKDESVRSKHTGFVRRSKLTKTEVHRLDNWRGFYRVVFNVNEILEAIGYGHRHQTVKKN